MAGFRVFSGFRVWGFEWFFSLEFLKSLGRLGGLGFRDLKGLEVSVFEGFRVWSF